MPIYIYSKRYDKLLLSASDAAIYGSFCKAGSQISNTVNC